MTLALFPDGPESAGFLDEADRRLLRTCIAQENAAMGRLDHAQALRGAGLARILTHAVGG